MFLLSLFLFSMSVSPFSCYYCSQSSLPVVVVVVDRLFPSPSSYLSLSLPFLSLFSPFSLPFLYPSSPRLLVFFSPSLSHFCCRSCRRCRFRCRRHRFPSRFCRYFRLFLPCLLFFLSRPFPAIMPSLSSILSRLQPFGLGWLVVFLTVSTWSNLYVFCWYVRVTPDIVSTIQPVPVVNSLGFGLFLLVISAIFKANWVGAWVQSLVITWCKYP